MMEEAIKMIIVMGWVCLNGLALVGAAGALIIVLTMVWDELRAR